MKSTDGAAGGPARVSYLWILIVPVQMILNRVMGANEAGRPEG